MYKFIKKHSKKVITLALILLTIEGIYLVNLSVITEKEVEKHIYNKYGVEAEVVKQITSDGVVPITIDGEEEEVEMQLFPEAQYFTLKLKGTDDEFEVSVMREIFPSIAYDTYDKLALTKEVEKKFELIRDELLNLGVHFPFKYSDDPEEDLTIHMTYDLETQNPKPLFTLEIHGYLDPLRSNGEEFKKIFEIIQTLKKVNKDFDLTVYVSQVLPKELYTEDNPYTGNTALNIIGAGTIKTHEELKGIIAKSIKEGGGNHSDEPLK